MKRAVLLLWMLTFWIRVVKTRNDTEATPTDGLDVTDTAADETSLCSWNISAGEKGSLFIAWRGNASEDSDVEVDAKMTSVDPDCRYVSARTEAKFVDESIDLRVCPNVQYEIAVRLLCSNESTAKIWSPPAPPQNVTIGNVNDTSITISWTEPSGSGPIELYNVSVSGSSLFWQNSTFENTSISGLQPYTEYYLAVAAKNPDFWGKYSDRQKVKTKAGIPYAAENLTETSVTNTSVVLKWDQPPVSTGPILGYRVRWDNDEEDTLSDHTVHTVKGLSPYVRYAFSVLALTEAGPGDWSTERIVHTRVGTPHAPENLVVSSSSNTSVSLQWEPPSISTGPILRYLVLWKNSTGEGTEETEQLHHTVRKLAPYVEYTFKVSAVTEVGPGRWTEERTARTNVGIPHAPTELRATRIDNTSLTMEWTAPGVSTGPILGYRVLWKNSSGAGEENTSTNGTEYRLSGLTPYLNYTLRVSGLTSAGQGEWSEEIRIRTDVGIPHAPRGLTITKVTNTSVSMKWEEPSVSTGPVLGYRVRWMNSSGEGEGDTTTSTSHTVEHLSPYVDYAFIVLALSDAGPGEWSEEVKSQTKVGVPHTPRGLTVAKVSNTSVVLKWMEPSVSTGPIVGYRVRWKNSSGHGEEDAEATPSHTLKHLSPYVDYTFKVLALTDAGPGEWSEEVKDRTAIGVPHAVEKFVATKTTNTSVDMTWVAPAISTGPILRYRIRWQNSSGSGEEDAPSNHTFLRLDQLAPYVYYKLRALALTEAGPGEWSEELTVRTKIGVPHPPMNVTASDITNSSVLIGWSEPEPQTGPVLLYTVRWTSPRNNGSHETGDTKNLVAELFPHLHYTFSVSASTEAGRGEWSESIIVQTDIGVPSAPRNLHSEQTTNTSLFLLWNRPEHPNAPLLDYTLTYRLLLRDDVDSTSVTLRGISDDKTTVPHVLRNLQPYTYYSIRVSASSRVGRGPPSNEFIVQTEIGVPAPAKIVDVKVEQKRTAVVRWLTEGAYPGPVDYSVETWKYPGLCSDRGAEYLAKELKGSKRAEEWRREHATEVGGLSPFGVYRFKILLETSVTDGHTYSRMSETIRIAPETSSSPLEVRAECMGSPTELRISWKPPEEPNGLITSYRIQYGIQRMNSSRVLHVENMCQSQSYLLTGLRPERRYLVSVSARVENVSEDGAPARPDTVCTLPPGIPFLGDPYGVATEGASPRSLRLVWTNETFSDYMGTLIRYAVLVGRPEALGNSTSGRSAEIVPPWSNFSSGTNDFYQATPPDWNPFRGGSDTLGCESEVDDSNRTVLRCTVGSERQCPDNETYCNGPLEPDTLYEIKIRAFTGGGFTETNAMHARSRPIPRLGVAGKVVSVLVVLLSLLGVSAGVYVAKKKGHLDPFIARIRSTMNSKGKPPKPEECEIQMEECKSPKPIETKFFAEHVRIMMSDSHLKFSLEFERLKNESSRLPCTVAEMEENRPKNRWMNIFPFDHSRVKLLPLCDDPGSDFINANYIPGYSSRREYIATQGPLPHTLDDFWRMVWEQGVGMIVMLTQCVERGKKKCEVYWPDSTAHYGDLRITTVSVSMLSSYIIRIFHLHSGSYERVVKQMHFTHWPDFGCPESPEDLINFVNAVRDHLPRVAPGPILVHCSAGVGRTGTFIAVDRLMLRLRHAPRQGEDTVDVYGTVLELRQHRTNMVQTEDQYIYIHLCVRQLIQDRDRPPVVGSQENIYSNVAIAGDSPEMHR